MRYAVAVSCVFIAFGIRFCLTPLVGEELPFMLFIAAVLVAAWYGGAMTGGVALVLGLVLADYFFLPRKGVPGMPESIEIIHCLRYLFTASIGIGVIEVLHRGRRRTQAAVEALEREVVRRKHSEEALVAAQAQLSQHAEALEQRVGERTAELEATVQSLEGILYHLAHNLRAPLRAMEGYSALLREQYGAKLDLTGQDYSKRICDAARHMDVLILDLLEYGRLGRVDVALANINLEEAVNRALGQLAFQCRSKGVEVKVIGPLPEIRGDARVLEQVLINLLDNAIKFVVPGTIPHIQIWAEPRAGIVRLCIQDNGIGVEPQHHERIFRPFERLHSGNAYEGAGIGLAIVKEGVQRISGQVGIQSQLGQGSRFWVDFKSAGKAYDLAA